MRTVNIEPPAEIATRDGLAYALFLPPGEPAGGALVLHGAGSQKESHFDFARRCRAYGLAALVVDLRGHGASDGELGGGPTADVAGLADLLRERGAARIGLRGSSMGGYLALVAAAAARADAVVAICPAPADGLRRGLAAGRIDARTDAAALDAFLAANDAVAAAAALTCPLLLLHAEGDEIVPVQHSRELHAAAPGSRLVVVPGGDHRSVQHDAELQDLSVRFLLRSFAAG